MIVQLFLFDMIHWSRILDNRWLLSNNFCKTCQNQNFQVLSISSIELRKRKPQFDSKFLQKKKIWQNWFQYMIAYSFFFHMVHWSFILGQGWMLSNNFYKACQNCFHPSFVIVHTSVRTHLLLLCCESPAMLYHAAQTTPTWRKPIWHVL